MRRTATVFAALSLLLSAPALAQAASPSPSAVCPNVSYVASAEDRDGPANTPVTIEGGSDVQPARTPDRWTLTRVSPGPVEVVDTVEGSPTFSFTVTVIETTTFRIDAVGPEGCEGASATFTRTVTGSSASPSQSPSPACTQPYGSPSADIAFAPLPTRTLVAGDLVTVEVTFTGGLREASARLTGYDWETPTRKGSLPLHVGPGGSRQHADTYVQDLPEGETVRRSWTLAPTTNTRVGADVTFTEANCGVQGHGPRSVGVLDVAPRLTLSAVRHAVRDYTFSGTTSRDGQVLSLYRVTATGYEVLSGQTRTAAGRWSIRRTFTGSGRFGFRVRTGRDMATAPGLSRTRPTLVY